MHAIRSATLASMVAGALAASGAAFAGDRPADAQAGKPVAATVAAEQVKPAALSDRGGTMAAQRNAVRNWARADANGDGLVSPDEMEAYLKANPGPLARGAQ